MEEEYHRARHRELPWRDSRQYVQKGSGSRRQEHLMLEQRLHNHLWCLVPFPTFLMLCRVSSPADVSRSLSLKD